MGLAGKFVFYNHTTSEGIEDFCQHGEIVEQCGDFHILIKWDRCAGDQCPHDAAMALVPVEEMTALPGEDHVWQIFATRDELDAYRTHVGVRPFEEDEVGGTVVHFPPRTH